MSDWNVIQRAGFVKRAPTGKLSAFKKWERKWMVFCTTGNKPSLDFFDDRAQVGKVPAQLRLDLSSTKQVVPAIDCKVPYSFLILTDDRIINLAAQSQQDKDAWIEVLRKILSNIDCLESKQEDHDYQIHHGLTRQLQVASAEVSRHSSRRRPPTPPPEQEDSVHETVRDGSPRSWIYLENDFAPRREHDEETLRNAQQVLTLYEDTPSSYDSEDQQVIAAAHASRCIKDQMLLAAENNSTSESCDSCSLSSSSQSLNMPRAVPRVPHVPRIEHDFSPALTRLVNEPQSLSITRSEAAISHNPAISSQHALTALTLGSLSGEASKNLPSGYPDPHCYGVGDDSEASTPAASDLNFDLIPKWSPQLHLQELHPRRVSTVDLHLKIQCSEQEPVTETGLIRGNSRAVNDDIRDGLKALPAPAPRHTQCSPAQDGEVDNHENAMGALGRGVSYRSVNQQSGTPSSKLNDSKTDDAAFSSSSPTEFKLNSPSPALNLVTTNNHIPPNLPNVPQRSASKAPSVAVRKLSIPQGTLPSALANVQSKLSEENPADGDKQRTDGSTVDLGAFVEALGARQSQTAPVLPRCQVASGIDAVPAASVGWNMSSTSTDGLIPAAASAARIPTASNETTDDEEYDEYCELADVKQELLNLKNNAEKTATGPAFASDIHRSGLITTHKAVEEPVIYPLCMEGAPPPYTPPRLITDKQNNMALIEEDEYLEPKETSAVLTKGGMPKNIATGDKEHPDNLYDYPPQPRPLSLPQSDSRPVPGRKATTLPTYLMLGVEIPPSATHSSEVLRLEDTFPRMPKVHPPRPGPEDAPHDQRCPHTPIQRSFSAFPNPLSRQSERECENKPSRPPKPLLGRSVSMDRKAPREEDYESVIPKRVTAVELTEPAEECSDSSSDSGARDVQLSPTLPISSQQTATSNTKGPTRRKTAPPSSLQLTNTTNSDSPPLPSRKHADKKPLHGGTLLREGKIFRAPHRSDEAKGLPLKQSQIEMLKEEIEYSHGVKITVYRKDLKYTLFVDIMNGIWVAGWNQKERPLLHNVFHVGDKVLSVNGETFASSNKLIKVIKRADSQTKFEFVMRRLPFAKAYFVHRNIDNEDIGLELNGGSSEICGIQPGSLIAAQGLRINPNKAFGVGQCHWVITEINHRPLSLFTSGAETHNRLSAVGKDITFVVQPWDMVDALKRQLKSVFGYRDYLLQ